MSAASPTSPPTQPRYDLVVFGATGFVGTLLCQYLVHHLGPAESLAWAIAGRSQAKLDDLATRLGPKAKHLPRLVANITDESTLRELCAQTRVVISTVGPYALYGEPLVKVCAETGTDYCDLTGETQWIRRMIQTYEDVTQHSGARIVHCCGFDSIPSDLGVYYLQQQSRHRWGHPCQRVKMRLKAARGGVSGGTAASGINLVKDVAADPALAPTLANPYVLCPAQDQPWDHPPVLTAVHYDGDFQAWSTPFIMAAVNTPIVLRSNALQGYAYGQSFHYDEAILTGSGPFGWLLATSLKVGLDGLALVSTWSPGRWLLEHTVVPAPGQGPSAEAQAQGFYDLRFWGQTAQGQTIRVKVAGDRDPGYGSTAKILGQAGICLAQDVPKSTQAGGFWTPASLFGDALIERLINYAGLTFEVL
ncbi:Putative trans-acting enoyl reductase [Halomicronema hongdechloris C2206]|uniref:Trans-acting enoyl reductase n=1 Tax=Halomicronema hongdechloris C2206 TaxID=1641165 RepID=A0A1Z3HSA4_9CYAN|nr:saccharopine dehydrogenase NADP-binding domain-containing protein [Halomicronema hongdechloris]ASC73007.1 Putative trans-acting enoyl reductase [Halomicronema hongdechloris C2206]